LTLSLCDVNPARVIINVVASASALSESIAMSLTDLIRPTFGHVDVGDDRDRDRHEHPLTGMCGRGGSDEV